MRRSVALLALAAAGLVACSGGDDALPPDSVTETVVVPSGVDLGTSQDPTDVTLDGSSDEDPDPTGVADPAEGTCTVDVTGDETASWTGAGGSGSVDIDYWLTPEERESMDADFVFFLACSGDGGSLTFLAGPNGSRSTIRFGAATYRLAPADGPAGGSGSSSPLGVVLRLDGDRATWGLAQEGTVSMNRLDESQLSATVDLTFTDVSAALTSVPPRTVHVTGTFEFDRPQER